MIRPRTILQLSIILILIAYFSVNSSVGIFTAYEYTFWQQKEQAADELNAQYHLDQEQSILYMDPGDAPYYFKANSSCHYITPMPVERSTKEWNFSYIPQYKETEDCILAYKGKYIIADINRAISKGFFGAGILENKKIMRKLQAEYTPVAEKSWTIYQRKENITSAQFS